jgi:hypothetical protein
LSAPIEDAAKLVKVFFLELAVREFIAAYLTLEA